MKKNTVIASVLLAAMTLSGCAQQSNKVEAAYVSPIEYSKYSCKQLKEEAHRVAARASEVAGVQDKKAMDDAVATTVALVVFWPAAFFINGNKTNATELANLKGQLEAIEDASDKKKCGIVFKKEEKKPAA
ncbi:MAG: hypothetical protein ACRBBU_12175 [Pseudooceanicola sp.]